MMPLFTSGIDYKKHGELFFMLQYSRLYFIKKECRITGHCYAFWSNNYSDFRNRQLVFSTQWLFKLVYCKTMHKFLIG